MDQDAFRIAYSLNYLGDLARMEQNYSEAAAKYREGEVLLRQLTAQQHLATILSNLGFTLLHLGEIESAQALFQESIAIYQATQNKRGMLDDLVGFAACAIQAGIPAAGARLLAAAESISGLPAASTWPATQMEFKRYLELARARLTNGDFQTEQAAGRGLSLEQALAFAVQLAPQTGATAGSQPLKTERPGGLTERELEIAALIGQGMTNGEIAAELVLSKRTVEKHAANILSRLGLSSRAQIVRWAIEQVLTRASE